MKIKTIITLGLFAATGLSYGLSGSSINGFNIDSSKQLQSANQNSAQTAKYLYNLGQFQGGWNLDQAKVSSPYKAVKIGINLNRAVTAMLSGALLPTNPNFNLLLAPKGSQINSLYGKFLNSVFDNYAQGSPDNNGIQAIVGVDVQTNPTQNKNKFLSTAPAQLIQNNISREAPGKDCPEGVDCSLMAQFINIGGVNFDNPAWKSGNNNAFNDNANLIPYHVFTSSLRNQYLVPSLNANSLMSPFAYNTEAAGQMENGASSSSSSSKSKNFPLGLFGKSQAAQADNFIRYATGQVLPMALVSAGDYNSAAEKVQGSGEDKLKSMTQLNIYTAMIRTYAAQSSVSFSTLYYIMSKRLPNTNLNNKSQAEIDFHLATKRLTNGAKDGTPRKKSKWMDEINHASSLDVQRQMAILLAEMNYQMYQSRMDQERMLMVLAVLQGEFLATLKPTLTFENAGNYMSTGVKKITQ